MEVVFTYGSKISQTNTFRDTYLDSKVQETTKKWCAQKRDGGHGPAQWVTQEDRPWGLPWHGRPVMIGGRTACLLLRVPCVIFHNKGWANASFCVYTRVPIYVYRCMS